ncbi:HAMP domain-containing sensor histidine kinase [Massilia sp. W12]|uniref:HAMP domain-containing sensor histidine kinase n=1 Tax=Massilia sp. W12 TaxID=3126507 RepID=UPI0030D0DC7E
MKMFACRLDVLALQQAEELDAQGKLRLAWYLRQSDVAAAQAIAQELAPHATPAQAARLRLIAAEAEWLQDRFGPAWHIAQQLWRQTRSEQAAALFSPHEALLLAADAACLMAWIAFDQGRRNLSEYWFAEMEALSHDLPQRRGMGRLRSAVLYGLREPQLAWRAWQDWSALQKVADDPGLHTSARFLLAAACREEQDWVQALAHASAVFDQSCDAGMLRLAFAAAIFAGNCFNRLQASQTALEWVERGRDLAQRMGSRRLQSRCLSQSAEIHLQLQQYPQARRLLQQAQALLMRLPQARREYALCLQQWLPLHLECGEAKEALERGMQLQAIVQPQQWRELLQSALLAQARALFKLARNAEAQQVLDMLLAQSSLDPGAHAQALALQAQLQPAAQALALLQRALQLTRDDHALSAQLLEQQAALHIAAADYAAADQVLLQALQARMEQDARLQDVCTRALQLDQETSELRQQTARQFAQLQQQAEHTALLAQTNRMLEQLGRAGQEITLELQSERVCAVLHNHLHSLLACDAWALLEIWGDALWLQAGALDGVRLEERFLAWSECESELHEALRDDSLLLCQREAGASCCLQKDSGFTSAMYLPLSNRHDKLLVAYARREQAFGATAQQIFSNLGASAAIALQNCAAHDALSQALDASAAAHAELRQAHARLDAAHRDLQQTRARLLQQENMAALGQLIANVAHEVNTPGSAMQSAAQSILDSLQELFSGNGERLLQLDQARQRLFLQLVQQAAHSAPMLSSKQERQILRALQQELEQAGIAQARHMAGVLHDLRAQDWRQWLPLLQGADAQQVLQLAQQLALILRSAERIRLAFDNLAKIVFALDSFAPRNGPRAELQKVSLRDCLDATLALYHGRMRRNIELDLQYEEVPPLWCRADELNQVWINLVKNALQAMQYNGRLQIRLYREGQQAVVAIADSGCGIAPQHQDKIFERFFTTKAQGEGSGLGLDIVRDIVESHGGRISFTSTQGQGTCFYVHLPLTAPASGGAA